MECLQKNMLIPASIQLHCYKKISTIRRQNTTIFQSGYSPISLDIQYAQFSNFLERSQIIRQKGGVFKNLFPEELKFSSALYHLLSVTTISPLVINLICLLNKLKAYIPDVISEFTTTIKVRMDGSAGLCNRSKHKNFYACVVS
ncbi:putative alpha-L-fucosidase [Helianthus debilis subsp. tardiflorus]